MDSLLETHSKLELPRPIHGVNERHGLSSFHKFQNSLIGGSSRRAYKIWGFARDSSSALLELVPETKKEDLEFDLPLYDPSKGHTLDLAVVVGGSAGLAVAQQVSQAGLSVCSIAPSPKLIWPNYYGVWVDKFEAMDLLDCLDATWSGLVLWSTSMKQGRNLSAGLMSRR